jgi:hypothetical protein
MPNYAKQYYYCLFLAIPICFIGQWQAHRKKGFAGFNELGEAGIVLSRALGAGHWASLDIQNANRKSKKSAMLH